MCFGLDDAAIAALMGAAGGAAGGTAAATAPLAAGATAGSMGGLFGPAASGALSSLATTAMAPTAFSAPVAGGLGAGFGAMAPTTGLLAGSMSPLALGPDMMTKALVGMPNAMAATPQAPGFLSQLGAMAKPLGQTMAGMQMMQGQQPQPPRPVIPQQESSPPMPGIAGLLGQTQAIQARMRGLDPLAMLRMQLMGRG